METERTAEDLADVIANLSIQGIQADRNHLIEDIGAQFADHREWVREYVVNAFDAGATWCRVSGRQEGDLVTIFVDDNGHGMDEQGVRDFMTLFRSVKKGDPIRAIGRFGIGKASIIAIPQLAGLVLYTSTGTESWALEVASFVDRTPVVMKQFQPPMPAGTRFAISYRTSRQDALEYELNALGNVLHRYVRFLPMSITVQMESVDQKTGQRIPILRSINSETTDVAECFTRRYSVLLDNLHYSISLAVGKPLHELYQNNVLVSERYNLLTFDKDGEAAKKKIPHLQVRVDSAGFELPFGRHCLRNEHVLKGVAQHIRERILPEYFEALSCTYRVSHQVEEGEVSRAMVEDIACGLLGFSTLAERGWCSFPVFATVDGDKFSYNELLAVATATGSLYLENARNPGLDYTVFDSPVLAKNQPQGGLAFLQNMFDSYLVNLEVSDLIMEQPGSSARKLNADELAFQDLVGFHPTVSTQGLKQIQAGRGERSPREDKRLGNQRQSLYESLANQILSGMKEAARNARKELEQIKWRVNYLVERDGKTPCTNHRFLAKDDTVVVNLYHPEVKKLLLLSKSKPDLAGHWSLAMCLTESSKVLSHLSGESREDLIMLDAVARLQSAEIAFAANERRKDEAARTLLGTFLDDLDLSGK